MAAQAHAQACTDCACLGAGLVQWMLRCRQDGHVAFDLLIYTGTHLTRLPLRRRLPQPRVIGSLCQAEGTRRKCACSAATGQAGLSSHPGGKPVCNAATLDHLSAVQPLVCSAPDCSRASRLSAAEPPVCNTATCLQQNYLSAAELPVCNTSIWNCWHRSIAAPSRGLTMPGLHSCEACTHSRHAITQGMHPCPACTHTRGMQTCIGLDGTTSQHLALTRSMSVLLSPGFASASSCAVGGCCQEGRPLLLLLPPPSSCGGCCLLTG